MPLLRNRVPIKYAIKKGTILFCFGYQTVCKLNSNNWQHYHQISTTSIRTFVFFFGSSYFVCNVVVAEFFFALLLPMHLFVSFYGFFIEHKFHNNDVNNNNNT